MDDATTDWTTRFPGLSRLEPPIRDLLLDSGRIVEVPEGTIVFGPGKSPENMLFLLDGTIRVRQISETGREIVLYRIHAGESCVLTTACLLAYDDYSAEGVAETTVRAAAVPRRVFDDLVARSDAFRTFVFATFSKRIIDLFLVIEEVAFQRMDVRLAQKIVELSEGGDILQTTHQKLSIELGTAREVVSRQLQEFQRRGWVEQARGTLILLDRAALKRLGEEG